ncbi:MAG: DUF3592 domain-containing protein [Planctomycetota bacterium]
MGYYFILIGLIIAAFAVWGTYTHLRLFLFGNRAQGTIVEVEEQLRYGQSQRKKIYFHPVIEFESNDGYTHQFTHGSGSSIRAPEIGTRVSVLYEDPKKARLHSFMGIWAGPLAAWVLALGALYAGIQLAFFGK